MSRGQRFGIGFIFLWFMLGGIGHFVVTDAFISIVPHYVPAPRFFVLFTGVCEIAGACALLMGAQLRSITGLALCALTLCVTPANLEMALHAERYPMTPEAGLWVRLAFQPVLLWIIWASTRESPGDRVEVRQS